MSAKNFFEIFQKLMSFFGLRCCGKGVRGEIPTPLTSQHNTEKLVRNVDVENRIKADNEKIYYIMEALNDAINANKKVSFQYFTYNVRKEQKLKHDGCTYVFSPYKLIWNGDYYYVVGYSEKHEGIGSFRVDRIVRCPTILEADAVQPPKDFDLKQENDTELLGE